MFLYGSKIIKKQKRTDIVKQKENRITAIFGVSHWFRFCNTGNTVSHCCETSKTLFLDFHTVAKPQKHCF
jgi:hypothetical protein